MSTLVAVALGAPGWLGLLIYGWVLDKEGLLEMFRWITGPWRRFWIDVAEKWHEDNRGNHKR